MKTRRGFLAALGLGAGASVLGLPATAQAWGRKRGRRERRCCKECGGYSADCAHCGSEGGTYMGQQPHTRDTATTDCACACPQYLYFQAGGMYYYKCKCCPGDTSWTNSSSGQLITSLPIPCSSSACIGSCGSIPINAPRIYDLISASDDSSYYIDPDSIGPDGIHPHAEPLIKGIVPKSLMELNTEIDNNENVKSKQTQAYKRRPVQYVDNGRTRYVALYDAIIKDSKCDLHIGIEVSKETTITAEPKEWGIPFKKGLPYYHHVYVNGIKYHVATAAK